MTRVTNFGIKKRPYLPSTTAASTSVPDSPAVGLGEKRAREDEDDAPVNKTVVPGVTNEEHNGDEPPPKKKRKRIRTPMSKRDGNGARAPALQAETTVSSSTTKSKPTSAPATLTGAEDGASGILSRKAQEKKRKLERLKEKKRKDKGVGGSEVPYNQKKAEKRSRPEPSSYLSESRRLKRINEKLANTTCFACRQTGHAAKDCPNNVVSAGGDVQSKSADEDDALEEQGGRAKGKGKATVGVGICYRCGSEKHTLSRCKKVADPSNPYPHASCFVCGAKGHLASACPSPEKKGGQGSVYPNGGCCKLCGDTTHLARHCGMRGKGTDTTTPLVGTGVSAGADEDDFMAFKRTLNELDDTDKQVLKRARGTLGQSTTEAAPKKKVVVFK